MNAKQLKKIHIWIRAIIQLLYFIFIPSVYTAAFAGVKYIFTQIGAGEKVALTSFVTVLIVVCVYTAVFGRFFCGFACAFGSLGDGVNALYRLICKKMKKKPVQIPDRIADRLVYLKYVILVIIVFMCYGGVYSKAQGTSPWDVFSMIHAGNFKLNGYLIGLVILVLLIVGMCLEERFFCRNSARWELYSHWFRCCRYLHFTETGNPAFQSAVHVPENVRRISDFRRMVPGK